MGPSSTKISELSNVKLDGIFKRNYVKIIPEEFDTMDLGYIQYNYNKHTGQRYNNSVRGVYIAATEGDSVLIALIPPEKASSGSFSGWLYPLSAEEYAGLSPYAISAVEDINGKKVVPFMIDGLIYDQFNGWTIFGAMIALIVTLWNLIRTIIFWFTPEKHKVYTSLFRYGNVKTVADSINNDTALGNELRFGKVAIFNSWIVSRDLLNLTVIKIDNILWIYKKVTKQYLNYIPSGKEYSIAVCSNDRLVEEIKIKNRHAEDILDAIKHNYPWIVTGYTEELKALWNLRFNEFKVYVNSRKASY